MLLKIGDFSRLSQVTIKALRIYDDMGLLKPAHIDPFTGYRHYTLDQLPHIHRIVALKELGLSLEQIGDVLREDMTAEQIQGMFTLKQAELEQRVRDEQARLAQVRFRLNMLKMEETMPELDIVVKQIEPLRAVTLRRVCPTQQDADAIGHAIQSAIARGLVRPTGQPMNNLYGDEFTREDIDIEFILPVDETHTQDVPLEYMGTMTLRTLPGFALAATYIHRGDYDALNEKLALVQRWVIENGYRLCDTVRFVYFRGPMHGGSPAEYITEIQHEIEIIEGSQES
ncbi:MAG TPA: MerR family transcriptional regulator [Spirillospora sp.]|nr:MerR family transcriptional regulator [Spirillospora sp.]